MFFYLLVFSSYDVIRAAIFQLSEREQEAIVWNNKMDINAVNSSDVSFRKEEIKRKLMDKAKQVWRVVGRDLWT